MEFATTDLCDDFEAELQVVDPGYQNFGSRTKFAGPVETIKCFEDNSLVRDVLETEGNNRVLVVDGGGSMRCALLGGNLAVLAEKNHWVGVVVYGCIRDRDEIEATNVGVKALAPHPLKSVKRGIGEQGVALQFSNVQIKAGDWLYADRDGMVVSARALTE